MNRSGEMELGRKCTENVGMLGTNHGEACRINVVTVEQNARARRGNSRKHGWKSDVQNRVNTYTRERVMSETGRTV